VAQLDTLVVGAGIAGLTCAVELQRQGQAVAVLERARGVGGRCATRRVAGQPVDHGPTFLHGKDPSFLEALTGIEGVSVLEGWPYRVEGPGRPCHPDAFRRGERRLACAEGLTAWPKAMARELDVRLRTRVIQVDPVDGGARLHLDGGKEVMASTVVLTAPLEQTAALLATSGLPTPALRSMHALLGMLGTVPCLSLIATFDQGDPPPWDIFYPERGALQLIAHDSAKRPDPGHLALVFQATPRWSREHLEAQPEEWSEALLNEAAGMLGPWVRSPTATHPHRWRYARVERWSELARPLVIDLPSGGRIGLAGEAFSPGNGVQAAWRSGRRLARSLTSR
jgi:predicted NAD/FAD-dependent oxidoreductase